LVNGYSGNKEHRIAAEAIVRVPPQSAVGRRLRVVVVKGLWTVEALHAGSGALGGKEADSGE